MAAIHDGSTTGDSGHARRDADLYVRQLALRAQLGPDPLMQVLDRRALYPYASEIGSLGRPRSHRHRPDWNGAHHSHVSAGTCGQIDGGSYSLVSCLGFIGGGQDMMQIHLLPPWVRLQISQAAVKKR